MPLATDTYRALRQAVSTELASLGTSTPDVMKALGDLGRAATAEGALDEKTKELSVAVRCDPCVGSHTQRRWPSWAPRAREVDETLGVAIYRGGGPVPDGRRQRHEGLRRVRRHSQGLNGVASPADVRRVAPARCRATSGTANAR